MDQKREFTDFFKSYQNTVYRVILGYVREREAAEDLAVEAFIRLYKRWKGVSAMSNPGGYLIRTGINLAKTHLKREGKIRLVDISKNEVSKAQNSPETIFFLNHEGKALERELMKLKEKERNILLMKDVSGHKFGEISDILRIKPPTVKSLYRRAKLKLIKCLEGNNERR